MGKWIFAAIFLLLTALLAVSLNSVEHISIPSTDRKASISVVIAYPRTTPGVKPTAVILVGGTGATSDGEILYPRDGSFVHEAFWYRDLASELVNRGFAVVRYDNRGLRSILDCERIAGAPVTTAQYLADRRCYDPNAAATTSFETKRQDLAAVFAAVARNPRFDPATLIVMAHSEGAFHVAAAIRDKTIAPAAIVMLSAAAGSPFELSQWQYVGRQYEWIERLIARNHGYVSNAEIERRLSADLYGRYNTALPLHSDQGGWTAATLPALKKQLAVRAAAEMDPTLAAPPQLPAVATIVGDNHNFLVVASNSVVQSFYTDRTRVVDGLAGYRGPISFIYGADDVIIPAKAQMRIIGASTLGAGRARVVEFANANHSFTLPNGTQSKLAMDQIGREVVRIKEAMEVAGATR